MNKQDFLTLFRQNSYLSFNSEYQFMHDNEVIVNEYKVTLEEAGNYHCPWHYNIKTKEAYEDITFEGILNAPLARVVTIKDVSSNKIAFPSKSCKIKQYIEDFRGKTGKSLRSVLVANDTKVNKILVLDSNHTLVALYKIWEGNRQIPVAEIRGECLIRFFPDFCIVYRS